MFQDTVLLNGQCHEFLNLSAINRVFQENRVGRRDHGLRLWALLVLELWLRNLKAKSTNLPAAQPVLT